jgi:hypothetical protein
LPLAHHGSSFIDEARRAWRRPVVRTIAPSRRALSKGAWAQSRAVFGDGRVGEAPDRIHLRRRQALARRLPRPQPGGREAASHAPTCI